ncbi:MAG: hypothetical protein AAB667_02305 [Patescibacteria group bacterium]
MAHHSKTKPIISIIFEPDHHVLVVLGIGKEAVGHVDFSFDNNLETLLIDTIDKLLKKNRIDPSSLNKVQIGGVIDKNSLAYRIARTVVCAME